ncbi:MAG: hypothetical protein CL474_00975 [Acidobacteria bacterium]|jgi:hypothetical protein|nr:hypothetical protein [Acidobacteriota bacterium]
MLPYGRVFRSLTVVLVVAVVAVASIAGPLHPDHGSDQDCAICQLRHQAVNSLTATPLLSPADWTESPILVHSTDTITSHYGQNDPARGPPA